MAKQDYTDALAQARQAAAAVAQNRAPRSTPRGSICASPRVPAPITGPDRPVAHTVGALVTTNQADPLATIQRLDPMYVDIQQSSADLLRLRRALAYERATARPMPRCA